MADHHPSQMVCQGVCSVALVANGAIHDYDFIASLIRNYDKCIAVDGGLIHCQAMNLIPDLILGDLDSISPELLMLYPNVPLEIFPVDKDHTDMELAINTANASTLLKIGIFGAMEKRTDHTLANLHLIRRFPEKIVIETERESIFSITGKNLLDTYPGQVISLIPIGSSPTGVTTKGLKWELQEATIDKNFISLSNVCLGVQVEISIEYGDLICCLLR